MRMYEVIDREQVLLETPEVLIDRIGKSVPRHNTARFMNELATKIRYAGKDFAEEEDLILLWRATCNMLHGLMSPIKRDKEYMDYEDRWQDMYFIMMEVLFDGGYYGTELYTRGITFALRTDIRVSMDLKKNFYEQVSMEKAEADNEPALAVTISLGSNMEKYLLDKYGKFAADWYYNRFVMRYDRNSIVEMMGIGEATYKRKAARLIKQLRFDRELKELWEEI